MLTREQVYTMLLFRKRKDSIFSTLPLEIIQAVSDFGQNPTSEIATALKHAAYARKEDVEALLALLDKNPRLLLEAGNVQTPGGDEVGRVTLYEFALGAGDAELAGIVQGYFAKIDGGKEERIRQYKRYKPHIEGILTQKPYDLLPLIDLIIKATPEQVTALLNEDMTGTDDLCKAFIQFREHWAPKVLTKPCMHYNYNDIIYALTLLQNMEESLSKAVEDNPDKIDLIMSQLLNSEMMRLPGIDRCVMAQGLHYVINGSKAARSDTFEVGFSAAKKLLDAFNGTGLAEPYAAVTFDNASWEDRLAPMNSDLKDWIAYVQQKASDLQNLCSSSAEPVCNNLSC